MKKKIGGGGECPPRLHPQTTPPSTPTDHTPHRPPPPGPHPPDHTPPGIKYTPGTKYTRPVFVAAGKNCMKMKEIGPRGEAHTCRPPLDPPMLIIGSTTVKAVSIHQISFSLIQRLEKNFPR